MFWHGVTIINNGIYTLAGNNEWNVIMWMDHRAEAEATEINKTNHEVLKYLGGVMSLEMQTPKLKWLKNVILHELK